MNGFDESAMMRELLRIELFDENFDPDSLEKLADDLTHMHLMDLGHDVLQTR